MIEHKDLLMRQLEQMARAIGALLGRLLGLKGTEEAAALEVKVVQEDLNTLLGMDIGKLVASSDNDFISQISQALHNDEKNLEQLADILFEMAPYQPNSNSYYAKSLLILQHIMKQTKTYSLELTQKIDTIRQTIK